MKTFEQYIGEDLDLAVHQDAGNHKGSYHEEFAGKVSADAFHHKVNSSGSKVIERSSFNAPGIGRMHLIRYQGNPVSR